MLTALVLAVLSTVDMPYGENAEGDFCCSLLTRYMN